MRSILLILIFFSTVKAKSQSLQDTLLSINANYYLDKPIDSLLNVLPMSYDSIYTRAGSSTFVGAKIVLDYSSRNLWVYIYPYTHVFYTPLNREHTLPHIAWPLNQVRKEKIGRIIIWSMDALPLRDVEID
jgi:hypothetical protein